MAAEISKPDFSFQWASGGAIVAPSDVKIQTGWTAEVPPFQWENFAQNRQDNAILHLFQKGISEWDAASNYYFTTSGVRSYVQGSDGVIYVAVADSIGQNPTTDVSDTYWKVAFSSTDHATTTLAGIVELATTAEMTTGTSTTLVPPVSAIAAQLPYRGVQVYTTTSTWTVPAGVTRAWVSVSGGGGGGGGATSSTGAAGGGGGGGATGQKLVDLTGVTSVSVTIGAGGTAGVGGGATPGAGGTSSFGAFITAAGGSAGINSSGGSTFSGAGSGSTTGADVTIPGGAGKYSLVNNGVNASAGVGGDSFYGKGSGAPNVNGTSALGVNGSAGSNGGGGSGGSAYNATSNGGVGGSGIVVIFY